MKKDTVDSCCASESVKLKVDNCCASEVKSPFTVLIYHIHNHASETDDCCGGGTEKIVTNAIIADTGTTLIVVLNALRLLKIRNYWPKHTDEFFR